MRLCGEVISSYSAELFPTQRSEVVEICAQFTLATVASISGRGFESSFLSEGDGVLRQLDTVLARRLVGCHTVLGQVSVRTEWGFAVENSTVTTQGDDLIGEVLVLDYIIGSLAR